MKKLIKGSEKDLYRLYRDEKGVYYHYTGKKMDLKFKPLNRNRTIGMRIGHFPSSNFKILK